MTDEQEEGQGYYLVCMPVAEAIFTIPDSTQSLCERCDEHIYISPSGQNIMEEKAAVPVCIGCALLFGAKEDGIQELNEEQMKELSTEVSPAYVEKINQLIKEINASKRRDDERDTAIPDKPPDG